MVDWLIIIPVWSRQEAKEPWLPGAGYAWCLAVGVALMSILQVRPLGGGGGGARVPLVTIPMFAKATEKTVRKARRRNYLKLAAGLEPRGHFFLS